MDSTGNSRRQFLQASGNTIGLAWLATQWPLVSAAAEHAHAMANAPDAEDRTRFLLLTPSQARDVDAIAAQIVPGGDTPGAREAGVVYFIDHVHANAWQGHAEDFVAGLAEFQRKVRRHHAEVAQFADLPPDTQLAYLRHMDHEPFFGQMRFLTVLGLLSLPSYGGNAHKAGWKLVGFVDQHAWQPPFGSYDAEYGGFVPYPRTTQS